MPLPRSLLLSLAGCLALAGGCKPAADRPSAAAGIPPVNVRLAAIEQSTRSPAIRVAAELRRQTEADLSFAAPGIVERVAVRAGDRVTRGQELARLKPDPIEAQLAQANAAHEKARRDLARLERLQAERVATLENLQDARTAAEAAAAAVRIAEFHRTHAVIRAPADGTVLRRLAEPNEAVPAGQAIVAFAGDGDGWIATAGLSARDAARVAIGSTAEIEDGAGGRTTGEVIRIAAAADAATRTVPVEILLSAPTRIARSGLIVTALLAPADVPARAAVPLAAVRDGNGGRAFVFVLAPGAETVRRLPVEIEAVDGEHAFLRTELPGGHRVIVAGAQFLGPDSKVRVAE